MLTSPCPAAARRDCRVAIPSSNSHIPILITFHQPPSPSLQSPHAPTLTKSQKNSLTHNITPKHTYPQTLHLPPATHRLRCRSVLFHRLPPLPTPSVYSPPPKSPKFSTSPPHISVNTPSRPPIPASILHSPDAIQDQSPPHSSLTLPYIHIPLKIHTFHKKTHYLPHFI